MTIQEKVDDSFDSPTIIFTSTTLSTSTTAMATKGTHSHGHGNDLDSSCKNDLKTSLQQYQEIEQESRPTQKRSVIDKSPIASTSSSKKPTNLSPSTSPETTNFNEVLTCTNERVSSPTSLLASASGASRTSRTSRTSSTSSNVLPARSPRSHLSRTTITTSTKSATKRRISSPMMNMSPRNKQARTNTRSLPLCLSMASSSPSPSPKSNAHIKPHAASSTSSSSSSHSPDQQEHIARKKKSMQSIVRNLMTNHIPCPTKSHWTTTYQANNPCEDRYASLSNVFMTPTSSKVVTLPPLIRMSLFTVLDGHGGSTVSERASKILLPLLARNICQKLQCDFVHSGQLNINGKGHGEQRMTNMKKKMNCNNKNENKSKRCLCTEYYSDDDDDDDDYNDKYDEEEVDENSVVRTNDSDESDFDTPMYTLDENCHLVHNIDRNSMDSDDEDNDACVEPWYKAPDCLRGERDATDLNKDHTDKISSAVLHKSDNSTSNEIDHSITAIHSTGTTLSASQISQSCETKPIRSVSDDNTVTQAVASVIAQPQVTDDSSSSSSCDSSNGSCVHPLGPHEDDHYFINDLTSTIQKSFIEFDEEFMNSIDPISSKQTYLISNGKWNAGSCCLAIVVLQPLRHSGQSNPDSNCNGQKNNDGNQPVHASCDNLSLGANEDDKYEKYVPGKARMYTAHVGDCRAMMICNKVKSHSTTHKEYDSCSSSDDDEDFDLSRIARNRDQNHAIEIQDVGNKRRRSCSWDDSDSENEDHTSHFTKFNDVSNFEPSDLSRKLNFVTLTEDHTPYNMAEAELVRQRCKNAPFAICPSISGGIKRVAGSLSVTRALGDAYLKTPVLSFEPFRDYAPFITALPEVKSRILCDEDRIIVLASDGVWEHLSEESVKNCVGEHYKKRNQVESPSVSSSSPSSYFSLQSTDSKVNCYKPRTARMRMLPTRSLWEKSHPSCGLNEDILSKTKVSDSIVSSVLHKVRKKHKLESIKNVMNLPKGNCRRSKHDDITNMVIDLEGFVF